MEFGLITAPLAQWYTEFVLALELPYPQNLLHSSSEPAVAHQNHTSRSLFREIDWIPDIRIISAFYTLVNYLCNDENQRLRFVCQGQADLLFDATLIKATSNEKLPVEQCTAL